MSSFVCMNIVLGKLTDIIIMSMQGYNVFFSEPVQTGMVPVDAQKGGRTETIVAMGGRL